MKKIFISLPMKDKSSEEIKNDFKYWFNYIKNNYPNEDFELIDTYFDIDSDLESTEHIKDKNIWYLGKSIEKLSEADIIFFHPLWKKARGCIIENYIAIKYEIKIEYL